MNASTNPKSASASVNAMPRNMVVRTVPDADAGADGGAAVDDPTADGGETRLQLTRCLCGQHDWV